MKRRLLTSILGLAVAAIAGATPVLARADTTATETCYSGTTVVAVTTFDQNGLDPGNFALASSLYTSNNPQGFVCTVK